MTNFFNASGAVSSMPVDSSLTPAPAAQTDIQQVRWRGGWGFGAGFVGGALVGSALASPYYYGYGPYYGPGPYYYGPGPYYYGAPGPAYGGDAVAYCMQRFRSYNPNTGTYMGYDGRPHPCP
jgi:BA14K-like protein